jgi:hypothetical protein
MYVQAHESHSCARRICRVRGSQRAQRSARPSTAHALTQFISVLCAAAALFVAAVSEECTVLRDFVEEVLPPLPTPPARSGRASATSDGGAGTDDDPDQHVTPQVLADTLRRRWALLMRQLSGALTTSRGDASGDGVSVVRGSGNNSSLWCTGRHVCRINVSSAPSPPPHPPSSVSAGQAGSSISSAVIAVCVLRCVSWLCVPAAA